MPGLQSMAEQTVQGNTPIPYFAWTFVKCVVCGSDNHTYVEAENIIYPHATHPDARENALEIFANILSGRGSG